MEQNERTKFEEAEYKRGFKLIAGIDEAGRGPLAGPVVAAACIMPRGLILDDVKDSKQLSASKREELYHYFVDHPDIEFGVGIIPNDRIDEINILRASLEAMTLAVSNLPIEPDYLLIDGNQLPTTRILSKAIIKGDSLSQSIGAASIIAKHIRDELMLEYHKKWPMYGFDKHKGYGTKTHLEALQTYGPCSIHRHSFEPVRLHKNHPSS